MAKQVKMPSIPAVGDPALQTWVNGIHAVVDSLQSSAVAPNLPTNLQVTPIAGGNVIQFTRSNATIYTLYTSNTSDRSKAAQVALGTSNSYTDSVGVGGQVRWYWVEGLSQNGTSSGITSPKNGTTLALGTPAPVIPIQQQSYREVFDHSIGRLRPVIPTTDPQIPGQIPPKE